MALSYQHIAPLATLLWVMALIFAPDKIHAEDVSGKVLVLASKESPELQGFIAGMKNSARLAIEQALSIPQNICSEPASVVAYGTDVAVAIEALCPTKDIVVLAQSYNFNLSMLKGSSNTWGYYLDQPIATQVRHASMNMPSIRTLGILYSEDDFNKAEIEAVAKESSRVKIQLVKVQKGQVVAQIMRDLYQSVDAVLITGNPEIWSLSDFKTFLVLGMRQGKIMIGGFNYNYMNRGSISAVHSDFFAMGVEVAEHIAAHTPQHGLTYFKKRQIVTNDLLAARYGIYIGNNNEW